MAEWHPTSRQTGNSLSRFFWQSEKKKRDKLWELYWQCCSVIVGFVGEGKEKHSCGNLCVLSIGGGGGVLFVFVT